MTALPPSTDFTGAAVTESGFKTAITSQRDYLNGLLGSDGLPATGLTNLGGIGSVVADTTPQLGGFLDPNSKYIGSSKGADIASASPLVIGTDGDMFDITGTTAFSVMTVAANRLFILQWDGAVTVTHGASIVLPGSANVTTAAGDVWTCYSTAANVVIVTNIATAAAAAAGGGKVVQVVDVHDGTIASGTTTIPIDNTIPQNTEGTQFMSLAITPTNVNNKLIIECKLNIDHSATNTGLSVALFQDAVASALSTTMINTRQGDISKGIYLRHVMTAGTTSATTFKIRGGTWVAGTFYFNNVKVSGPYYGGTLDSSITITEISV